MIPLFFLLRACFFVAGTLKVEDQSSLRGADILAGEARLPDTGTGCAEESLRGAARPNGTGV